MASSRFAFGRVKLREFVQPITIFSARCENVAESSTLAGDWLG
jgi:hypothetical protein